MKHRVAPPVRDRHKLFSKGMTMKHFKKLLALLFVFLLVLNAQTRAEQKSETKTDKKTKHIMWKVHSGKATVYMLGSIHAAKKDLYPLSDTINKAFEAADALVLEIHLDAQSQAKAAQAMMKAGMYGPGDSLEKHLNDRTKKLLDAYAKDNPLVMQAVGRMKPWMATLVISVTSLQKAGFNAADGIDLHFQAKATKAKKEILELESVDLQVHLFTSMKEKSQVKMLHETLKELPETSKTIEAAFEAWSAGDARKIDELMLKDTRKKQPEFFKKLFTDRNAGMAKKIEKYFKTDKTYFVVVGAGHLIGKDGVVDLLQKKGYKVEQQ